MLQSVFSSPFVLTVLTPGSGALVPAAAQTVDWRPMARLVDSAIAAGAAPGGVVALSIGGVRYLHGAGRLGLDDTTRPTFAGHAEHRPLATCSVVVTLPGSG